MDRIDCLRAFVRALEGGSFSAAAKELGIGQPAVSKRIAMLESEFGTQLFLRTTRKLKPTPEGHRIYDLARQILGSFDLARAKRRGSLAAADRHAAGQRAVLVRPALHDAGHRRICPELSGGACRHPLQRALRQSGGGRHRAGAADRTSCESSTLVARRLGTVQRYLVATPTYLHGRPLPRTPTISPRTSASSIPGCPAATNGPSNPSTAATSRRSGPVLVDDAVGQIQNWTQQAGSTSTNVYNFHLRPRRSTTGRTSKNGATLAVLTNFYYAYDNVATNSRRSHLFQGTSSGAASRYLTACSVGQDSFHLPSERFNTRATHIQCSSPSTSGRSGAVTDRPPANRVRSATASGYASRVYGAVGGVSSITLCRDLP